jgi:enoyl-CoA hydratase
MSDDHLLVDDDAGIRTITLNRPEAKNALTQAMRTRLGNLLSDTERDPSVRAVIIAAADPVFSAGVDFKEVSTGAMVAPDGSGRAWNAYDAQFTLNPGKALRAMSKPVIAAVNGACVSGGLEIALSCSFVVASERARFADTHARLGVVATWGLTALLPRAVGIRKAREMSSTGNFVGADEALRLGLVNHVVEHDQLIEFTRALAAQVPELPSIAETLLLYERGQTLSLNDALALETQHTIRRSFDADAFGARGRDTAARNQQS